MIFWTIVEVAFKSLIANKLRSVLAMLGIIIGVWSVISSLAFASGIQQKIINQMSSLGTNVLMVSPAQRQSNGANTGTQQTLKVADAFAILTIDDVSRVSPVVRGSVQARYYNKNTRTSLLGAAQTYFTIRDFKIEFGRMVNDADCDAQARVAVVGPKTAENLFGTNYSWAIDQFIQVKGVNYRIIGFMKSKGDQGWFNPDEQIIIPFTTAMSQVLGVESLQEIDISAKDETKLPDLQNQVTMLLRKRHRLSDDTKNDFNINNMADILNSTNEIRFWLSLLLGGIAAISLFVGGIGVMNIMLVTVTERTREIGIRKAIGARKKDILLQFLIEAVVMSGTGGMIGIILGLATAWVITLVQSMFPMVVQPLSAVIAMAFAACVGIFFGFYPALRAAKLDPIEALRYE